MSGLLASMLGAVSQGLIWSLMVLGVYITYKLLDIADMTTDGSFVLGGCVCATLMLKGCDPTIALVCGAVAGGLAGAVTGVLHTFFGIPAILAGILTQISLWSINLRIMSDKSNQSINKIDSDITFWVDRLGVTQSQASLIVGVFVVILAVAVLYWFFGTELGCSLRATGANQAMARAQGINTSFNKVLALMISNGLVSLSGALLAQYNGSNEINVGRGAIVIGLAAVIIGEVLLGKVFRNFGLKLLSVSIGAIIYYIVMQAVLALGLNPNYLKLLSAAVVAIFLATPYWKSKYFSKPVKKGGATHA